MVHSRPKSTELLGAAVLGSAEQRDDVPLPPIVDTAALRNGDVSWDDFSSQDYWRHNYVTVQPEDQEIIDWVSKFFIQAFASHDRARRAIDVGSGANLYPALLMLPWTDQILLSDFSASNVRWLRRRVLGADDSPWDWQPFWDELAKCQGYGQIDDARKQLRDACKCEPGLAGIEQRSLFDLPRAQWELGTMFFVAESMTEDHGEFQRALSSFVRALTPRAPFAAAFMAGSTGYPVAGVEFPALPVTVEDIAERLNGLGVTDLSVHLNQTEDRVRPGYAGMIVATGFAGDC